MTSEEANKLFKIAELITEKIKYAMLNPGDAKHIDWNYLRDDWFDYLENEFFPENENDTI